MSGDVHVGGYGVLQAHPKVLDRVVDPRFMLQVSTPLLGPHRVRAKRVSVGFGILHLM